MSYENLLTSVENGILTITINRPDKLNALNKTTVAEIGRAIEDAKDNDYVKAVIITRAKPKSKAKCKVRGWYEKVEPDTPLHLRHGI